MNLSEFVYDLPEAAIAQTPREPRDAARLLDTRDMSDHVFRDLPDLLTAGDLVVVNTTRVRRARLRGVKQGTGGAVELVLLDRRDNGQWQALVSPARRIRAGQQLHFDGGDARVVSDPVDGVVDVTFAREEFLDTAGAVPLPPYIRADLADPERYQTVYADVAGSAAAPTAGLHFTPAVLDRLGAAGVGVAEVELRVGLGTFRPIATPDIDDHRMHAEWCSVPAATAVAVQEAKAAGRQVVAIGTTTVRALESRSRTDGTIEPGSHLTDLFLRPGWDIRVVDALVTNFHMPGSSLLVLLAAVMGDGWREAYRTALERGYRFLSFGDAMFCERVR